MIRGNLKHLKLDNFPTHYLTSRKFRDDKLLSADEILDIIEDNQSEKVHDADDIEIIYEIPMSVGLNYS